MVHFKIVRELPISIPRRFPQWLLKKLVSKLMVLILVVTMFISMILLIIKLPEPTLKTYPKNTHRLAVIVPFRNVFNELMQFVPHMKKFLGSQDIPYKIYVINQIDNYRFNRAMLLNVGCLVSKRDGFDYMALHDIDLLPLNSNLSYAYPSSGPLHISSPNLHPAYHYEKFLGGILVITHRHYLQVNGMSNRYWGWGLEDDEFRVRLFKAKIKVSRPVGITTGTKNTFLHNHNSKVRVRDYANIDNQRKKTSRLDRQTGVDTVKYVVKSRNDIIIDGVAVDFLNVELVCNKTFTPWCEKKRY